MHSTVLRAAGLLALTTTAIAGSASVVNRCKEDAFLTVTLSTQQSTTHQIAGSNGSYSEPITGQGNSWGITKTNDYFSASTPKLIWGFSDAAPTLYYTVSNVDGDPMAGEGFNISSTDAGCGSVTSYDGSTHTCSDSNNFTLTLC